MVGVGTIGTIRARILRETAGVDHLYLVDTDRDRLDAARTVTGADGAFKSLDAALDQRGVAGVVISTTETDHLAPTQIALDRGLPVLVEKPLAILPDEAQAMVAKAESTGSDLRVGFTQRFRRRYSGTKEMIDGGRLGKLTSMHGRIAITRAIAETVVLRTNTTTPSVNTMTYIVDLLLWYANGDRPRSVYAQHSRGELAARYGVVDATSAIVTFDSGLVASISASWEPPRSAPANVASMSMELNGIDGMVTIMDNHSDHVLVTNNAMPSAYPPHALANTVFGGSAMPGERLAGIFLGPMKDETLAWWSAVRRGAPAVALADGAHGLDVLNLCRAVDNSATTGMVEVIGL